MRWQPSQVGSGFYNWRCPTKRSCSSARVARTKFSFSRLSSVLSSLRRPARQAHSVSFISCRLSMHIMAELSLPRLCAVERRKKAFDTPCEELEGGRRSSNVECRDRSGIYSKCSMEMRYLMLMWGWEVAGMYLAPRRLGLNWYCDTKILCN